MQFRACDGGLIIWLLLVASVPLCAQDLSYSKSGHLSYREAANPAKAKAGKWSSLQQIVYVSFASSNTRYAKEQVPQVPIQSSWQAHAWKGEKIHTQLLVWTKKNLPVVNIQLNDLKSSRGAVISASSIKARFVRYTLADGFVEGCSQESSMKHDSLLTEDPIDIVDEIAVAANSVQPIWLSIEVPADAAAGMYTGTVTVQAGKPVTLKISLQVSRHVLPPPAQWKYDLDIWQYPAPVARIHDVPLWSDEHFRLMRQYFTYLASAGQKVITANIIEQPWGLDHVHFDDPSLIKWTKKKDGSWTYDFSLFEKYVSFLMDCGIDQRINCFTMVTWDLGFIYYDEASGGIKTDTLQPGSQAYAQFWEPMLIQFTQFLKAKGWFNKTCIAMDERPVESMQAVISLLKKVDPAWKIALSGDTYHPEITDDVYDYSLASYLPFDKEILNRRKKQGKPTTFYTACGEPFPSGYTVAPPAENALMAWFAASRGLTGYLFWAYNTWNANPLVDSRWKRYPAGTLFQFYPGPRTSIRFEKLVEGIQDFEKIRLLREQFTRNNNKAALQMIKEMLAGFTMEKLKTIPASVMLDKGKKILVRLSAL